MDRSTGDRARVGGGQVVVTKFWYLNTEFPSGLVRPFDRGPRVGALASPKGAQWAGAPG